MTASCGPALSLTPSRRRASPSSRRPSAVSGRSSLGCQHDGAARSRRRDAWCETRTSRRAWASRTDERAGNSDASRFQQQLRVWPSVPSKRSRARSPNPTNGREGSNEHHNQTRSPPEEPRAPTAGRPRRRPASGPGEPGDRSALVRTVREATERRICGRPGRAPVPSGSRRVLVAIVAVAVGAVGCLVADPDDYHNPSTSQDPYNAPATLLHKPRAAPGIPLRGARTPGFRGQGSPAVGPQALRRSRRRSSSRGPARHAW